MTITIAVDSYKGSLSSRAVADAIERGIRRCVGSDAPTIHKIPIADGGEGSVDALISALGGEIVATTVTAPLGGKIDAEYGLYTDADGTRTAVIECCAAGGITLVPAELRNPMQATSYGVGEQIAHAIQSDCRKIILGIGGSATNDGAMGILQALGFRFYDKNDTELGFGGKELASVHHIDDSGVDKSILDTEITVFCDVRNPLYGENGAAYVYAPQKGADADMVRALDDGLRSYAEAVRRHTGKDISDMPGAGAAGGIGGGLTAFLNATLTPGMDAIADILDIESKIAASDLVFTGEGKTDRQTAFGKAPAVIAGIAAKHGVPVVCLSGGIEQDAALYECGIGAMFSITDAPMSLDCAMQNADELIANAAENIFRTYKMVKA